MGKITINELHKSLFDYVQTISDDRLETRNKTIVGAINELFSNNKEPVDSFLIKKIACGNAHIIALCNDDTLWACGYNLKGQLGLGDITNRTTFVKVENMSNIKDIACGQHNTYILKNDGTLWACGDNNNGQLGIGTYDENAHTTFIQVPFTGGEITHIACGKGHVLITCKDGSIWGCGDNSFAQLGIDVGTDTIVLENVTNFIKGTIDNVKKVACGQDHTIVLKNDGTVWGIGYNLEGELGTSDTENKYTFVNTNMTNVKDIVCGYWYTFVLTNNNEVYATGYNNKGQLGLGDTTDRHSFTKVNISDVSQIACGFNNTYILKTNGGVYATGHNNYGQLGLGDTTNRHSFTKVTTEDSYDIAQITCGVYHGYILKKDGTLWSVGSNQFGQLGLGLGTTANITIFTKVDIDIRLNDLINEISNGKQLIADSIGEPLNAEDTFSAMSGDINGLLSTFKTNMMNNGITVESGDKFKSLIDKIATMVEEGEGKGIQYASGIAPNNFSHVQIDGMDFTCLNISLNFKPTILIVRNHGNYGFYIENFYPDNFNIVIVDNGYDEYVNVKDYEIDKGNNNYSMPIGYAIQNDTTYYWAVGVGEEDTTLRDSLASILEDEGVDVTEENTMADLITKVDEEFDRKNANSGLDIISATELPTTGKNNQICVVTNNLVSNFVLTTSDSDITTNASPIYGKLGYGTSDISGTVTIGEGIQTIYRVDGFFQGGARQNSYIYQNNQWNQFTKTGISIIRDKAYCTDTQLYGKFPTYTNNSNVTFEMQEGNGLDIYNYSSGYCYYSFIPTAIDISAFNRIVLKWDIHSYGNSEAQCLYILGSPTNPSSGRIAESYTDYTEFAWTNNVYNSSNVGTLTANISDMTGTYYIGIGHYYADTGGLYVYDFYLE